MSAQRDLLRRVRQDKARPRFEPCLPRSVKAPPSGDGWLHEIKHDGFRIIGYRDANGVCLMTRNGYDFSSRFPLAAAALAFLPVRSCVIDSEAIVCDNNGLAVFEMIRWRRHDHAVSLCAFDLLELDGTDVPRTWGRASIVAVKGRGGDNDLTAERGPEPIKCTCCTLEQYQRGPCKL
jgi:ATP-dependent DNA ligase